MKDLFEVLEEQEKLDGKRNTMDIVKHYKIGDIPITVTRIGKRTHRSGAETDVYRFRPDGETAPADGYPWEYLSIEFLNRIGVCTDLTRVATKQREMKASK